MSTPSDNDHTGFHMHDNLDLTRHYQAIGRLVSKVADIDISLYLILAYYLSIPYKTTRALFGGEKSGKLLGLIKVAAKERGINTNRSRPARQTNVGCRRPFESA